MRESMIARWLMALIRGEGSEFLRGDLQEWWDEEQRRRTSGERRRSFELEILKSVFEWWRPRSVGARLRGTRLRGTRLGGTRLGGTRPPLQGIGREVAVAIRTLVRRPGYALLVVGVLGMGIGATTTVLTVVDRVLIRTLPYPDADRLAVIGNTFPDREWREDAPGLQHLAGFSLANFVEWESRTHAFESIAAIEPMGVLLPDDGAGPEIVQSSAVTPDFFDLLDVSPALGRLFVPGEFRTAAPDVVVLSHQAWVTRFGSDPTILGSGLTGEEGSAEIIGVLPPDFDMPEVLASEVTPLWFPIEFDSDRYESRGRRSLNGMGRLRAGTSIESARTELAGIGEALAEAFPDGNVYPDGRQLGVGTNALQAHTVGATRRPIALFMGAALLLMLISGLNSANLIFVRGLAREDEIGVRLALGAGRGGVVRLFVVEALILAVAAGVAGLFLAHLGVSAFRALGPESVPRMAEVGLDARIAAIAALLTLGLGVVVGVLPALKLATGAAAPSSGARSTQRPGAWRWTVSAQVALSMLLMVSAGLLMESFLRLRSFDPGFESSSALTFAQGLKRPGTGDLATYQLWDQVIDEVRTVPGYTAVAAASNLPFESPNWAPWVLLPEDGPESHRTGIAGYVVSHGYFETLGIGVRAGRVFERSDGPTSQRVLVVNRAFVDEHMPNAQPIGATLRFRSGEAFDELQVIGVVDNTVQARTEDGMQPAVFVSYTQVDWPSATVFARATGDPLLGVAEIRQRIAAVNPYVPPRRVLTMDDRIATTQVAPRFNASLALAFGLVSLLLSAGGLYASLSFGVGRRVREIGVRLALGATRGSVLRLVLAQGLRWTTVGLVVGLGAALLSGSLLAAFLFDVRPTSPAAIGVVTVSLVVVAALACLGPAVRATRVDPVRSLNGP